MSSSASNPNPPKNTPSPGRPARPSLVQVFASALAAVSAAVVSSTFGVAGTLVGAAIASVVASVGSTLYLASLHRTNEQMRRIATAARRADRTSPVSSEDSSRNRPIWTQLHWNSLRLGLPALRRRWPVVAGLAALVFAITIGTITVIEAAANEPVAALIGGHSGGGTSVGHVLDTHSATGPGNPAPTPSPATTPRQPGIQPLPSPATPGPAVSPTPASGGNGGPVPSVHPSVPPTAGVPTPKASPTKPATLP